MNPAISLDFTIKTARCILRSPSVADIPDIFAATRIPGFHDGMVWEAPATIAELSQPLRNNLLAWSAGTNFTFTIIDRTTHNLLGRISIRQSKPALVWTIGYWTHPSYQQQGYMTEAATAVVEFGFNKLDVQRIEASYAIWNTGSQRVLEKIGMKFVAYLPQGFQKKGKWVAENSMAITKEEWLASRLS